MKDTIRLYDTDPYGRTFESMILRARVPEDRLCPDKDSLGEEPLLMEVILEATLFFPEEGGQTPDTGTLNGCPVTDVQIRDGVITHTVEVPPGRAGEFSEGAAVSGCIDWEERFSNMQNHSGEHIISGLLHKTYGFNNIGFRLSRNTVTLDFDGQPEPEKIFGIEEAANRVVWHDLPILAEYPSPQALAAMEYRSKIELEKDVRIVTIPGVDACACCAPHVKRTGEIGMIRIMKIQRFHGGTRLTIVCGRRALHLTRTLQGALEEVSRLTSRPQEAIGEGVRLLQEENAALRFRIGELEREIRALKLDRLSGDQKNVFLAEKDLSPAAQREMVNSLCEKTGGMCGVFAGSDQEGYKFIIGGGNEDARKGAAALREAFGARGGGKREMVQGAVRAPWKEIEACLRESCRS